ncbi:MAG: hypothetical protein A2828_04185 [Candidatus Terrybacteria bacterium RIFCSPHIGHO2_01_FULL_43_35]|uniref:Rrf2 family transcriptional regulator n=1 Tax=Candidatus Terrybacteria bacterium RIFCSPHIGHO2_01_FULL_43_35 TaxID=1802361 RepID=A0A1G2PHS4_9BACT|nr:MAG: hypothetical protein A2828_04185 [Candidatus Terrybacteria bacterium RIFCSPHIGHO2_01_FULL_43_35]
MIFVSYLAEKWQTGQTASLSEVTSVANIPQGYLEEIAGLLRKAGIVRAKRGARGGYFLAKKPEHVSVVEIVEAIEGPIALVGCMSKGACTVDKIYGTKCNSRWIWQRVQNSLVGEMRNLTLKDVLTKNNV